MCLPLPCPINAASSATSADVLTTSTGQEVIIVLGRGEREGEISSGKEENSKLIRKRRGKSKE